MREQVKKCLTSTSPHVRASGKFLLVASGIRENFDIESGIQFFGIQNRAEVSH